MIDMSHCGCSIRGRGPEVMALIDEALSQGVSMRGIERAMRLHGIAIKSETVMKHFVMCLNEGQPQPQPQPQSVVAAPAPTSVRAVTAPPLRDAASLPPKDLARLVQQRVVEGLESGDLKVTVKDGLSATAILDKREARTEDRKFMVGLARLLSGAGHAGPQGDDPNIIDVTPANPLLAPESLRGDD